MPIVADSLRSLNRLHIGRQLLAYVKMMGLPSLSTRIDGFQIKAIDLGDGLEKISIRAPLGIAVAAGTTTGVHLFIADSLSSEFAPVGVTHYGDYPYALGKLLFLSARKYKTTNAVILPGEGNSTTPALYPHPSEAFWLAHAFWSPQAGDPARVMAEVVLNQYPDRGRARSRTSLVAQNHVPLNLPPQIQAFLDQTECKVVSAIQNRYGEEDGMRLLGAYLRTDVSSDGIHSSEPMYALLWFYGLPSHIRNAISYTSNPEPYPVFTYAWENDGELPTVMHACTASSYIETLEEPASDKWRLFLSFYTIGSSQVTTFNSDNFLNLLHNLKPSYGIISGSAVDWDKAATMLRQLIGYPVQQRFVWPDTSTFAAPNGEVYTWTRAYGAVKFSRTTGLTAATLTMPAAVLGTLGTRPTLTYLGNDIYFCSADKRCYLTNPPLGGDEIGVLGIYRGSPFIGWTELPMPPAPWKLMYVRPAKDNVTSVLCFGVVYKASTETEAASWRFAILSGDEWRILASLKISETDPLNVAFDIVGFGDDPIVSSMANMKPQPTPLHYIKNAYYSEYQALLP